MQQRAMVIVIEEEEAGLQRMELNKGIEKVLNLIDTLNLKAAICTRNNQSALVHFEEVLRRHNLCHHFQSFHPLLWRESPCPVTNVSLNNKPHPDPAHAVLRTWGVSLPVKASPFFHRNVHTQAQSTLNTNLSAAVDISSHSQQLTATVNLLNLNHADPVVLFVGDHIDDVLCGHHAHCTTCFLTNGEQKSSTHVQAALQQAKITGVLDYVVHDGLELAQLIEALHWKDYDVLPQFAFPRD